MTWLAIWFLLLELWPYILGFVLVMTFLLGLDYVLARFARRLKDGGQ